MTASHRTTPKEVAMESTKRDDSCETTIMSMWPSIAALPAGRWLGRLYSLGPQVSVFGIPFRPGWLVALATVPIALFLYFNKIVPRIPLVFWGFSNPFCRRYRLTTNRVLAEHPYDALSKTRSSFAVKQSIALGEFDAIGIVQQPGHEWFRCADLVFCSGATEVLRLPGVPHAETFRQTCLKANQSHAGILAACQQTATNRDLPAPV